jgi:hypothetical protein
MPASLKESAKVEELADVSNGRQSLHADGQPIRMSPDGDVIRLRLADVPTNLIRDIGRFLTPTTAQLLL